MSFPRKRESSFFALDPCFRRGDIVGFRFPQQVLLRKICFLNEMIIIERDKSESMDKNFEYSISRYVFDFSDK